MGSMRFWVLFMSMGFLCSAQAYQFYVGGRDGWVLSPKENYNQWAGRNRFLISDSLIFKYKSGEDSVLEVTQEAYNTCNASSPISSFNNGNSVFVFQRSGPFYFISGAPDHCQKGQKLLVVVLADRQNIQNPPSKSPSPAPKSPSPAPKSPSPASQSPAPAPQSPVPAPYSSAPSHSPASNAPTPSPYSSAPTHSPASNAPTPSPHSSAPSHPPVSDSPIPSTGSFAPSETPGSNSPSESPSADAESSAPSPGSSDSTGSGSGASEAPSPTEISSSTSTSVTKGFAVTVVLGWLVVFF